MRSGARRLAGAPAPGTLKTPRSAFLYFNRPYYRLYALGAGLALCFVSIELAPPLVIQSLVDRLAQGLISTPGLLAYFALLLSFSVAAGFARYFERILMIGASRHFEYDLRNAYFAHLQLLAQAFFRRTKTGDLMARATNDLNYVRMFAGPGVMGTVDMIRIPFTLGLMVHFSLSLTFWALLPLPVVTGLVYFFLSYMHRQSTRVQEQFSVVTARAQENLAGARVVRAYAIEDREIRDFHKESELYMRESMRLSLVLSAAWPVVGLVVGVAVLLVLWFGGTMVIDGALTLGGLSGFVVCLMMLTWPLAQFGWVMTLYQRGAVSMKRILEILNEEPGIRDAATPSLPDAIEGRIVFDQVSFAYDSRPVLHAVSFEVPAGATVALVGPTGSGKSSIVSLMLREADPTSGCVLIDGVDARAVPLALLRGAIGYVPQDTFLFSETARENVAFGRPEATPEAIAAACEIAQIRATIEEMPDGYDTMLGERGINLSGGQKQRLAIARALLRDPRILILDDALSSVDTHTEEAILQRLKAVMARRTSIVISHRVSTVRHADLILVVKEGSIVERGKHDDLVALGGVYADMYERQLLEDELDEHERAEGAP